MKTLLLILIVEVAIGFTALVIYLTSIEPLLIFKKAPSIVPDHGVEIITSGPMTNTWYDQPIIKKDSTSDTLNPIGHKDTSDITATLSGSPAIYDSDIWIDLTGDNVICPVYKQSMNLSDIYFRDPFKTKISIRHNFKIGDTLIVGEDNKIHKLKK